MLALHSYGIPDILEYQNSGTTDIFGLFLLLDLVKAKGLVNYI